MAVDAPLSNVHPLNRADPVGNPEQSRVQTRSERILHALFVYLESLLPDKTCYEITKLDQHGVTLFRMDFGDDLLQITISEEESFCVDIRKNGHWTPFEPFSLDDFRSANRELFTQDSAIADLASRRTAIAQAVS